MSSEPIVYVVDDDPSVRKSLGRLLRLAKYRVEMFASGQEFMARQRRSGPACVVLDIRMPGLSGLDLQEMLTARNEQLAVVFITGHGDIPMTVRAMKAGAVDFLTKPYTGKVLLEAVRRGVDQDAREQEARARAAEIRRRMGTLTRRETGVFARVVMGHLNKQIAADLGISEKTVKIHRGRVMEKMQADSVADLVRMAETLGTTLPPD